jgi:gamma-glutamyltranspeptidase/glutathione hydrolase
MLASQAGYEILEAGGNAIDAGVAAGIALGIVHSEMVQFSGVAPIMIYLKDADRFLTISGLGGWPKRASIDYFIEQHGAQIPIGLMRTVVPGAPDAWIMALRLFGTMPFGDVAAAAIRYARDGFPMHHVMYDYVLANEDNYRRWPENEAIFLPGNRVPEIGERFVQRDLASAIQYMVDEEAAQSNHGRLRGLDAARDAFYRGDLAVAMTRFHRDHGGWLHREDLESYSSGIDEPISVKLGSTEVYTCGPWCQGPVLAQMVRLLDGLSVQTLGHNSPAYIHTVVEAMKLAFADREAFYGDPRFVDVPMDRLLSEGYTRYRRGLISTERAWSEMPPAGDESDGDQLPDANHERVSGPVGNPADTSYCCAVDRDGNVFSATPSDVSWESPVIPGTGFCPSTRGSQSWAVHGHPSSVAPGKRPRLTPNPAIARKPGHWIMPFGTPGGDNQTQAMLQVLLNVELFGMAMQDAIEAPRFMSHSFPNSFEPHHYFPARVTMEGRIPESVSDELTAKGHEVERLEPMTYKTAGVCAIRSDLNRPLMEGGADPRRMSRAIGR